MKLSRSVWFGLAVAIAFVVAVVGVSVHFWADFGANEMSAGGWTAMILGIVAALALGIGLMSLVFISNRRGYDDPYR